MSAPWNVWDWDYLWHFLGGVCINGAIVGSVAILNWPWGVPFGVAVLLTLGGVIREEFQHNWDWLTKHQWLEGVLWGVGGLVAALVGVPFYG